MKKKYCLSSFDNYLKLISKTFLSSHLKLCEVIRVNIKVIKRKFEIVLVVLDPLRGRFAGQA